jgi:predicted Zn finger-like uncharacterized protein
MSTVRLRRLKADFERLSDYVRRHPRLRLIQSDGDPPERYQLEYQIKSVRMVGGELQPVRSHVVEIALPLNYPRTPPQCRMLSPVFHPNIAPHAICVGDHWGAGESLQSIVSRIGEMLAYQSYNVKSPLNGAAARWVEENKHRLPLDRVSLLVEENGAANGTTASAAEPRTTAAAPPSNGTPPAAAAGDTAAPAARPLISIVCPACAAAYRMPPELAARKVRCRKCMQVFEPAAGMPNTPGAGEQPS